jgi:prepilin-type N-terminal cleavage/methylation domain-containing protein
MRQDRAFTLVELMIVVLILGVLAAVAVPRIMGGSATANANVCKTNIALMNSQTELYHSRSGVWPADLGVVTKDNAYFPDGEPKCPITKAKYDKTLVNNRVDTTDHNH